MQTTQRLLFDMVSFNKVVNLYIQSFIIRKRFGTSQLNKSREIYEYYYKPLQVRVS